MIERLAEQLAALLAVAGALWWIGRAGPVAEWFVESPALGLAILLAGFALLVGALSLRPDADIASFASI